MHCSSRTGARHTTQHTPARRFQRQHKNLPVPAPARQGLVAPNLSCRLTGPPAHTPVLCAPRHPNQTGATRKHPQQQPQRRIEATSVLQSREQRSTYPLKQGTFTVRGRFSRKSRKLRLLSLPEQAGQRAAACSVTHGRRAASVVAAERRGAPAAALRLVQHGGDVLAFVAVRRAHHRRADAARVALAVQVVQDDMLHSQ